MNALEKMLSFRKSKKSLSDIEEEIILEEPSYQAAIALWVAGAVIYGARELYRCVRKTDKGFYPLIFPELFSYIKDFDEWNYDDLKKIFSKIIESESFERILQDPFFIID